MASASAAVPASAMLAASADALAQPTQQAPSSSPAATAPPEGYAFLGPAESAFVETMVNVMCPADGLTPNGVDCGLAIYIDRQLAGAFGRGDRLYMQGPWLSGPPQLGYQLPLTPAQYARAGIAAANAACQARYAGRTFDQIDVQQADAFLLDVAAGKVVTP
ncbi:MAG TPA: gluconate 2-dehydrogenase subunit 3 family protein, partial [Gemmatimonadales bacterium]|nr:gluconate 2-dehydrogenase subunit 3 family protein [Gemmatimonadales bacterium]